MNQEYHEESYFFRFINLSSIEVELFQTIFASAEIDNVKKVMNSNDYVACVKLTSNSKANKIVKFIEAANLIELNYGIWISLFSNRDSDGISLPNYVINIFKETGGTIDFSYIYTE